MGFFLQLEYFSLFLSLWKDVTYNLKIRDIDAATDAKHRLEERQRAEAKARKEKEIPWETRVSLHSENFSCVKFFCSYEIANEYFSFTAVP